MPKKKEYTDVDYEMFVMPFGKHQGKTFDELPPSYLLWLVDQDFCPAIISAYVDMNEEDLRSEAECDATELDLY